MRKLSKRDRQPEIMDDPQLADGEHVAALRGLARVHALTGTLGRLWRPIHALIRQGDCRQLTVMDVGCGDGTLLRQLHRLADRQQCELRLIGCDFSARALAMCRDKNQAAGVACELHCLDVLREPLPAGADVIVNSLFLHHFDEQAVVDMLSQFATAARKLVVVEDLIRSPLGYRLCWLGVHLLTRSRVVHVDGPLSVRAAFSMEEVTELLCRAGLSSARLSRHWPERFLLQLSCHDRHVHGP